MAEKLTDEQREAIENQGGQLLVSAAAGSGKTKVLVDRLMRYITDPVSPANIDDFLIITYTKAAAAELRVKIGKKLSDKIAENPDDKHLQRQLQRLYLTKISTIHSFCSDVLKRYAYRLEIPADFRQAEDNECTQMMNLVLDRVLSDAYDHILEDGDFRAFVDTQGFGRNDSALNNVILKIYLQSVNFPDPDKWLDECVSFMDVSRMTDVSETKWGQYLMEALFAHLDETIPFMEQLMQLTRDCPGGQVVADDTAICVEQLRRLRNSETWDEILSNKTIQFPNFQRFKKKTTTPEVRQASRYLRNACKEGLDDICACIVDRSEVILAELRSAEPAVRGMCRIVKRFSQAYSAEKRRRHLLDYTDLEQMCLDLFRGKSRNTITSIARDMGSTYREVMIDEYQDSNAVQDAIFSALTDEKKNCFMVGDVKQSIYQFRQADPQIFLQKYDAFADAVNALVGQGRRVILRYNFRSGDEILQAANTVFATCMRQTLGGLDYDDQVSLKEGVEHTPLGEPGVELYGIQTSTDDKKDAQEAAFVAQRISELLDGTHFVRVKDGSLRPIIPEDIVILLRSPSSQEPYFAAALAERGIRFVSARDVELLEAQENMFLVSLLKVINNPQQDIPLAAVLCSNVIGFTADDLAVIRSANPYCSLYDAVLKSELPKAKDFTLLLSALRAKARMSGVCQVIEEIYARTGMAAIYASMEDGETRLLNMEALYQHAAEFEGWGRKDLARFVEHLEIMDASKLKFSQSKQNSGCISITSIHKSKGLEYPVVFLCGLSRGFSTEDLRQKIFAHKTLGFGISATDNVRRILYPTISKKAIKLQMIRERNSEEIRVLYVAMTRPMDRLIMTYASSNLEEKIRDAVVAQNLGTQYIYARRSNCMGNWVMLAAVKRTEAGEFFNLTEPCANADVQKYPWLIRVVTPPEDAVASDSEDVNTVSADVVHKIRSMLAFEYPYSAATTMPSKQTATQLNRQAADTPVHYWRKPGKVKSGNVYGNLIHRLMEYLDYKNCGDMDSIRAQVDALVSRGLLSREEADAADVSQLAAFFDSSIGKTLRNHPNVLREFQLSILDDPDDPALAGEKVLLQGVVDCAMVDDDGIVILDFKTDQVSENDLEDKMSLYRPQISTYAKALSRIYGKPVKAAYLYFFRLNRTIPVI